MIFLLCIPDGYVFLFSLQDCKLGFYYESFALFSLALYYCACDSRSPGVSNASFKRDAEIKTKISEKDQKAANKGEFTEWMILRA